MFVVVELRSRSAWCVCCCGRKVMMSLNAGSEQSTLLTLKMSIRTRFLVSNDIIGSQPHFRQAIICFPKPHRNSNWGSLMPRWRCLSSASFCSPNKCEEFDMVWRSRPPSASDVVQSQRTIDAMSSFRCHWSWSKKRQRACMRPTQLKPNFVR